MTRRAPLLTVFAAALAALQLQACSDASTEDSSSGGHASSGAPGTAGASTQAGGAFAVAGASPGTSGSSAIAGASTDASGASTGGAGSSSAGSGGTGSGGTGANGGGGGKSGMGGNSAASAGAAGTAGGGTTETKRSAGCTNPATQALNQWVQSMVNTSGADRPYSVRLPANYDASRAYPVIVLLHGCGGGTNNVPMENAIGSDAILVRGTGSASGTCWDTAANGKDVAFFDSMVKDVKARFCADEHRIFVVGYSSGSWLVNQLTCIRADVLRGGATVTGGEAAAGSCGGPVARIFVHDSDDTTNVISGSEKARDRQLTQNSCSKPAQSADVDPSPCKLYQGCAAGYPVEWCQTSGKMHGRQDSFAPALFWNFFKAL